MMWQIRSKTENGKKLYLTPTMRWSDNPWTAKIFYTEEEKKLLPEGTEGSFVELKLQNAKVL